MANLDGFYGGRQGASFIIVKRFDGVDIPSNTRYKIKTFAQDEAGLFIVPLVERTDNNYKDYSRWGLIPCDGITTVTSAEGETSEPLPLAYLEGMRQCFERGGETTDVVNYGEYVIIDTIADRNDRTSPDNGKVYRRGFNYDYNPVTNPLAGAEYIGQIAGPAGSSPAIAMSTLEHVKEYPDASQGEYNLISGIVPGKYIDEHGEVAYNDSMKYAWVNITDNNDDAQAVLVGFTFPYMVNDFKADSRSAYYQAGDVLPADKAIGDKLADDFNCIEQLDDSSHPFYRQWKINIPKGIKGDAQTNLEIYPTKVVDGSKIYNSVSSTGVLSNPRPYTAENMSLDLTNYEITKSLGYAETVDHGYVSIVDTRGLRMRYLQTNYDKNESGESSWIDLGEYNTIEQVDLSEDGFLTVFYGFKDPQQIKEAIRWIKYTGEEATDGIQFNSNGSVTVTYNTKDNEGHNETQTYKNLISWLTSTSLDRTGHFKVIYNNNNNVITKTGIEQGKAIYESDLTWPTQASLNAAGVLKFLYNNNLLDDIYPASWQGEGIINREEGSYSFIIPWMEQVKLLDNGKINFTFNNNKLYNDQDPDWQADGKTYAPRITWVTKAVLDDNGDFKIYYNNDLNKARTEAAGETWISDESGEYYKAKLQWVNKVTIDADGIVHFWYNDETEMTPITGNMKIKCIDNIYIDTNGTSEYPEEGQGDQRFHIVYNTFEEDGLTHEQAVIGQPINYILDTHVVLPGEESGAAIRGHLYVYYSDPQRRQGSNITIFSNRLNKNVTGWIDLGDVRGDTNAQLVFAEYDSLVNIPAQPPEIIMGQTIGQEVQPNYRYAGWGAAIAPQEVGGMYHLALYDYVNKNWVDVGILIKRNDVSPNDYIDWSNKDLSNLKTDGFVVDVSSNDNTVRKIGQKLANGSIVYKNIGPIQKYVEAQQNSNTRNLEEQLILGTDLDSTFEQEVITPEQEGVEPYTQISESVKFRIEDSNNSYYRLDKTIKTELNADYDNTNKTLIINLVPKVKEKVEKLYYVNNEGTASEVARKISTFTESEGIISKKDKIQNY